ncbi:hypothetical protein PHYPO_G00190590 [Pangasianodon hypophthalmus]|uniref:Ig-like domain-containing protein n=1 Tax=Pangasianodon hypophthalmus TaxID=310915 RepID=A0A5N5PJN4_PANHP|nr:hypothetical protein PHYPO_G00190590 [Pangasianodon hypophthalmus]
MFRRTEILMICMVLCFQASKCEDALKVIGYIGEPVVLTSGVDESWTLSRIQWSIYENSTFIATFQGGKPDVNRWAPFTSRLNLDTVSGDLTIKNIRASDSMKYTVRLEGQEASQRKTSSIYLSVREKLLKPNITLLHSFLDAGQCVISLKCSTLSSNISLIWKPEHGFSERFCNDNPNVTRESVMWTSLRTNRDVIFSCIATDGNRKELRQWNGKCPVPEEKSCKEVGMFFLGFFLCLVIAVIIFWKIEGFSSCKKFSEDAS